MNIRSLHLVAGALLLLAVASHSFGQPAASAQIPIRAGELSPDRVEEVFAAPGRLTTLAFESKLPIDHIAIGAPIIQVTYERKLNQILITPQVEAGETNMNVRIGKNTYVILVRVVNDVRVQYLRTFTLVGGLLSDESVAAMEGARPLKPAEIDVMGTVKMIERARHDAVFRANYPLLRTYPMQLLHQWNNCIIYMNELTHLPERDMLVFKVEWINRTDTALYLDASQYGLRIANRKIPIIARYQRAVNSTVYPGQHETVYLFVQGYRLQPDNNWELTLPPDARAVRRMIK